MLPKQINMEQSDGKFKRYSKRTKVNMTIVAFMLFCGKPVSRSTTKQRKN